MTFNQINSSTIIYNIMDRFAIKSQDFATRTPDWVRACLEDLDIRLNLETDVHRTEFNNGRCLLPKFCAVVEWVVIDGVKANFNESLYLVNTPVGLNRGANFVGDSSNNDFNNTVITDTDHPAEDVEFANSNLPRFYNLENGWLKTNVNFGFIEIKYKHIPFVFDDVFGLEFPLIPDEEHLREAIMWFIITRIVMRGYVHSILSLDKRDRFTNPALAYEWAKPQARIHINGGTRDSREKWVAPLAALFGKRRPYYVKPKESETTITGSYVPTPDPVIPTPVTPGQIRIACAQLFTTFTILTYVKNSYINITAPLANGFNYFFISNI